MSTPVSVENSLGAEVVEICPPHLLMVALRSAIQCLKGPLTGTEQPGRLPPFPPREEPLSAISIPKAVERLLDKEPADGDIGVATCRRMSPYRPFETALLWGAVIARACEEDERANLPRRDVLGMLQKRLAAG